LLDRSSEWGKLVKAAFSMGEIGDGVAYQTFSFLVFPFYFTVVGLPILWISAGFIVWSAWNAFNDPLIGALSDRTRSKRGRRVAWMLAAAVPLSAIMVILFTPPLAAALPVKFVYFIAVLLAFDLCYTAFNVNYNAQWAEMFITTRDRSDVGAVRGIFVIISLIIAFILPTIMIDDLTNQFNYPHTPSQYLVTGGVASAIVMATIAIMLKWGARQRGEFEHDAITAPSMATSIKYTLGNRAFLYFAVAALATWICNGILPLIVPLFATYILGMAETNSLQIGLLLLVAFLAAGVTIPFWKKLRQAKGARFTGMVVFVLWGAALLGFSFAWSLETAFAAMAVVGIGLGGSIFYYDQCIVEIIDEDELKHGTRRAGAYYGVINFIVRFSGILNFLVIGLVFSGTSWSSYTPNPGVDVVSGLRFLMGAYPAAVLALGIIGLYMYPIKGKRLEEAKVRLARLHGEKRATGSQ
jgi:GPH family glycoside/pentoside/hexuronide:cation symporter